jgi:hypothetical protein
MNSPNTNVVLALNQSISLKSGEITQKISKNWAEKYPVETQPKLNLTSGHSDTYWYK